MLVSWASSLSNAASGEEVLFVRCSSKNVGLVLAAIQAVCVTQGDSISETSAAAAFSK